MDQDISGNNKVYNLNSLFRKFLLYNFVGLLILIVSTILIIIFLNNYQLNKRLKQIDNQSLIIYKFLKTVSYTHLRAHET